MNQLKKEITRKIVLMQDAMTSSEMASVRIIPHIIHYQIKGIYAREMWLPAGTLLVGKTHKKEHICVILKGKVKVVSEEFSSIIEAPYTYVSNRGAKRAMYAFTDLVWTTFHSVKNINLDTIEDELVQNETYLGDIK